MFLEIRKLNSAILIVVTSFIGFTSCQTENYNQVEIKIAQQITDHLNQKDFIKPNDYSNDVFLHIESQKLNDSTYKAFVSLNAQKSSSSFFQVKKFTSGDFDVIVYCPPQSSEFYLAEVFFVPDAHSWTFLCEFANSEDISLSEIKRVLHLKEPKIKSLEELEM